MKSDNGKSITTPLSKVRGLGAAGSGTSHFIKLRLTAIANIPLTFGVIFIAIRLTGLDYVQAKYFIGNPFISLLLLFFVLSIVVHMRLGMQTIIEDYIHSEKTKISLLIINKLFSIFVGGSLVYAILRISFTV